MNAIGHGITAIVLKKAFPEANLGWLLVSTEAVEIAFVGFNIAGIERTEIAMPFKSVMDMHLVHMPWSHSVLAGLCFAALFYAAAIYFTKNPRIGLALALGVFSHTLLDLAVHAPDMALAPLIDGPMLGTGLYGSHPQWAFAAEIFYALFCWWIAQGNWKLFALIVIGNLVSITSYFPNLEGSENLLAENPAIFPYFVLGQIVIFLSLIWLFGRRPRGAKAVPA
jgi:hypothetical protein